MAKNTKTFQLAITGLFIAFVLLLGLTPIGLIPLGFVNLTILHIPVIVGTILLGLKTGLVLGFCFGLVSLMSLLGLSLAAQSTLAYTLFAAQPVYAVLMCFIPRLLVPLFTHLVFKAISHGKEKFVHATPFAAVAGSVTNTVFYLSLMYLFYLLAGLDINTLAKNLGLAGLNFVGIVGAIAAGGGGMEALAAGIITPAITAAIWKAKK